MELTYTYGLLIAIFIGYLLALYFSKNGMREGLENNNKEKTTISSSTNGIAGGAQGYAASLQTKAVSIQDQLLIPKYRQDYENMVLNADTLINATMLQTLSNMDPDNPSESLTMIGNLNNAKTALNSIMKYIDSQ